jgi:hypothetical protein
MDFQKFNFKLVYWEDVREAVQKVNKPFAELIDSINPDKGEILC